MPLPKDLHQSVQLRCVRVLFKSSTTFLPWSLCPFVGPAAMLPKALQQMCKTYTEPLNASTVTHIVNRSAFARESHLTNATRARNRSRHTQEEMLSVITNGYTTSYVRNDSKV